MNDLYEVRTEDGQTLIYKEGKLRGMYAGTTQNSIILRQLIDAIRNADDEAER